MLPPLAAVLAACTAGEQAIAQQAPAGQGTAAQAATAAAGAANQTPAPQTPEAPLPSELGVIVLPQGPPPTGQQAPVPRPAVALPRGDRPLTTSPYLAAIDNYVQGRPITIQDAVAIALYTSKDLATAVANLQEAAGRAGQARAALNPTLGIGGDITVYDQPTTVSFGPLIGVTTGPASQPFVILNQFNPVVTTSLTLPLDVAGPLRAAASQAQFQEVASRIDVNRVRNQLVYNVKTAFYNALRAQAQVAVATDSLNNSLRRLSDANKNFAAGTSPRFDIISAQRDVADAQQNLINARAQRSVNMAALKNTIGLAIAEPLTISDAGAVEYPPGVAPPAVPATSPTIPPNEPPNALNPPANVPLVNPPGPMPAPPINAAPLPVPATNQVTDDFDFGPEFRTLLDEALKDRPEVLEGDAQIAAARRGIQYARRSQLPALSVSLSDVFTPNATPLQGRPNVGAFTLGVNIPVFDGGLARQRLREAYGAVGAAEVNRRQSVDTVTVDVEEAYIALVQARARVAAANVEVAQAREAQRLAFVRYLAGVSQQTGVSPQLELSNAQNTLAQAQSNQVNALYDFNNARAQLDRAMGRYSFTGAGPGYSSRPAASVIGVARSAAGGGGAGRGAGGAPPAGAP